eukprot:11538828-Alexandrium_andersonii.AAC.1
MERSGGGMAPKMMEDAAEMAAPPPAPAHAAARGGGGQLGKDAFTRRCAWGESRCSKRPRQSYRTR